MKDAFSEAMDNLTTLDKQILVERHLISREHAAKSAGSGLVFNREETFLRDDQRGRPSADAGAAAGCNCGRRGARLTSWIPSWRRSSITPSTTTSAI